MRVVVPLAGLTDVGHELWIEVEFSAELIIQAVLPVSAKSETQPVISLLELLIMGGLVLVCISWLWALRYLCYDSDGSQ